MRIGAVRARTDNHERGLGMPLFENRRRNRFAYFSFRTSDDQELGHAGVNTVDGRTGSPQRLDLGAVLDHPQFAQDAGGENRQRAQGVCERDQMQRRHRIRHRNLRAGRELRRHNRIRVDTVDPVEDGQPEIAHCRFLQRRQLQPRKYDGRLRRVRGDDQRGQALERVSPRTRQVPQIRTWSHHQTVETC